MKNLNSEYSTKVIFKIEKYDYEQGKRVMINKTFDKLNRDMKNYAIALDELGNLIVDAIGGDSLALTIIARQDNAI